MFMTVLSASEKRVKDAMCSVMNVTVNMQHVTVVTTGAIDTFKDKLTRITFEVLVC
jgi:hypothetical protein